MHSNRQQLIGRLGQNPELKTLPSGTDICRFSVATTEYYRSKEGEKKSVTSWHNIIAWGTVAKNAKKLLSKGSQIYLEGPSRTTQYETLSGEKRWKTDVTMNSFTLFDSRNNSENSPNSLSEADLEIPEGFNTHMQGYDLDSDTQYTTEDIPF